MLTSIPILLGHYRQLPLFILDGLGFGRGGVLQDIGHSSEKFDNFTCGRIDLMGEIVNKVSYK